MTTSAMAEHVRWSYDDRRDFYAYARACLASGFAQGERVCDEESNATVSFRPIAGTPSAVAVLSGDVGVDVRRRRFVDHRGPLHRRRHARGRAVTVLLRGARASVGRLADLLELSHVRVEIAG